MQNTHRLLVFTTFFAFGIAAKQAQRTARRHGTRIKQAACSWKGRRKVCEMHSNEQGHDGATLSLLSTPQSMQREKRAKDRGGATEQKDAVQRRFFIWRGNDSTSSHSEGRGS
jgi:hypothetical protein